MIKKITLIIQQNRSVESVVSVLGQQLRYPNAPPSLRYQSFVLWFVASWLQVGCYSFTIISSYCQVQRPAAMGSEQLNSSLFCFNQGAKYFPNVLQQISLPLRRIDSCGWDSLFHFGEAHPSSLIGSVRLHVLCPVTEV